MDLLININFCILIAREKKYFDLGNGCFLKFVFKNYFQNKKKQKTVFKNKSVWQDPKNLLG